MIRSVGPNGLQGLGGVLVEVLVGIGQEMRDGRPLLRSRADLKLAQDEALDGLAPVTAQGAGEILGECFTLLRLGRSANPYGSRVEGVAGLDVASLAGLDKQVDQFAKNIFTTL